MVSYGFDPEVAMAWLQDKETSWVELQEAQDSQKVAQAKADIAEAADQVKGNLDDMMAARRAKKAERNAEFEQELDAKVAEFKA